jgi:hypothetical protein
MESARLNDRSTATMRSPINWGLLGLLIQRPSYGYELVQRFERTVFPPVSKLRRIGTARTGVEHIAA